MIYQWHSSKWDQFIHADEWHSHHLGLWAQCAQAILSFAWFNLVIMFNTLASTLTKPIISFSKNELCLKFLNFLNLSKVCGYRLLYCHMSTKTMECHFKKNKMVIMDAAHSCTFIDIHSCPYTCILHTFFWMDIIVNVECLHVSCSLSLFCTHSMRAHSAKTTRLI